MDTQEWSTDYCYADSLLLYILVCSVHISNIIQGLNKLGALSGYRLDFGKNQCFPVNELTLAIENIVPFRKLREVSNIQVLTSHIQYTPVHMHNILRYQSQ